MTVLLVGAVILLMWMGAGRAINEDGTATVRPGCTTYCEVGKKLISSLFNLLPKRLCFGGYGQRRLRSNEQEIDQACPENPAQHKQHAEHKIGSQHMFARAWSP